MVDDQFLSRGRRRKHFQAAASTLDLQLHILHASTQRDIDTVCERLAALALRHGVAAIYEFLGAAGGLMSYGGSITDLYRLGGVYAGRILNGEKPAFCGAIGAVDGVTVLST